MKTIQINAPEFFETLKTRNISMWEIFAQLIDGTEKQIVFTQDGRPLFDYILPKTREEMEDDRKKFTEEFTERLKNLN